MILENNKSHKKKEEKKNQSKEVFTSQKIRTHYTLYIDSSQSPRIKRSSRPQFIFSLPRVVCIFPTTLSA